MIESDFNQYKEKLRRRRSRSDFEAIFTSGECFRFALRLHDRFQYEIRGIRLERDSSEWAHVWARNGHQGIDIHGVYPERILSALANRGEDGKTPEDVSPNEIRELIRRRGYDEKLSRQLDALADKVFDTHERFLVLKPTDPEKRARFGVNFKNLVDNCLDQPT